MAVSSKGGMLEKCSFAFEGKTFVVCGLPSPWNDMVSIMALRPNPDMSGLT